MTQKQANAHFKKNRIFISLFGQYVHVFFTKDDWEKAFKFREGDDYDHDVYSSSGLSFESVLENHDLKDSNTLFAIGIFKNDLSIAVHECVHITGNILDYVLYKPQKIGDEITAYLTEYLFREVSLLMEKHFKDEIK